MTYAHFSDAYMWRAKNAVCHESRVSGHKPDAIVAVTSVPGRADESVPATPDQIAKFIERSVADIPDARRKERARERMRSGLVVDPAKDDTAAIEEVWSKCEKTSAELSQKEFDQKRADYLRKLVCEDTQDRKAVAKGIIPYSISDNAGRRDFSAQLARGLLGEDGKPCAATKDLDPTDIERLRAFVPAPLPPRPASQINE